MSATCTKEREVLNCPVSSMAAIKTTLKDVDSMDYLNQLARNLCQDAHRSFGAKIPGRPGSFSSEVVINPESGETDVRISIPVPPKASTEEVRRILRLAAPWQKSLPREQRSMVCVSALFE
jgi:hypothetical protein